MLEGATKPKQNVGSHATDLDIFMDPAQHFGARPPPGQALQVTRQFVRAVVLLTGDADGEDTPLRDG